VDVYDLYSGWNLGPATILMTLRGSRGPRKLMAV